MAGAELRGVVRACWPGSSPRGFRFSQSTLLFVLLSPFYDALQAADQEISIARIPAVACLVDSASCLASRSTLAASPRSANGAYLCEECQAVSSSS